jgi:beta-fructofuranosidase
MSSKPSSGPGKPAAGFQIPNHYIGDCWSFVGDDRFHLFYLTCPDTVERHTRWSIAHASTLDFKEWQPHPLVLDSIPDDPTLSCLSTGSVIHFQDRYWLCFCGNHNSPKPLLRTAWSEDLETWHLMDAATAPGIDGGIYTERGSRPYTNPRWRDPYLFVQDDAVYLLVCAALEDQPPEADGTVGVLRTRDFEHWEYLPPLQLPPLGTDIECPKLIQAEGRWHLVVSLFDILQSPELRKLQPEGLNPNTSYTLVADEWTGPYRLQGNGRLYAEDPPGFPYANEVFFWQGQWQAIGICWSQHLSDRISAPVPLEWC